jgi:hypothetical protein
MLHTHTVVTDAAACCHAHPTYICCPGAQLCSAVLSACSPYINNETVTAPELLSQWLQDFALDKFKAYVGIAKKAGLPVRISETNSM